MFARIADWLALNKGFVTGYVCGMIAGGVLSIVGAWMAG